MNKYLLEIAVFICWAIVMIFELVWSRILAPFLWTSIYVWTSIIWVILWSLSIGYLMGWYLSDKKSTYYIFSSIILISSLSLWIYILTKNSVLSYFTSKSLNIETLSVLCSIVLFSPTSILLGIISPYAIKLKLTDIKKWATTVWNLYAISTTGSIIWTFLAWFILIPFFSSTSILISLTITLFVVSIYIFIIKKS